MFAPALLYLGFAGRLVEFKGLGLEAKFQQVASKPVSPSALKPSSPSASEIKAGGRTRAYFGISTDVVLLVAPKSDHVATRKMVFEYAGQIYPGLLSGTFQLLAVVDESERVLGYFPRSLFLDLLRIEVEQTIRGARVKVEQDRVGDQLEQTHLWDIVEFSRMRAADWGIKKTVRRSDSNSHALKLLADADLGAMVVVDDSGTYAGIITRDRILAELVGSLTRSTSSDSAK